MRVWQVATGRRGRYYDELFFEHDLMVIGPGDLGDPRQDHKHANWDTQEGRLVRRFADNVRAGDRVLMRKGREVIGVGQVPSGEDGRYGFDERFRSVYGWDLPHRHRVKWAQGAGRDAVLKPFQQAYAKAAQLPRFSAVRNKAAIAAAKDLAPSRFAGPLKELLEIDPHEYTEAQLVRELRAEGSMSNARGVVEALYEGKRLIESYRDGRLGRSPSEYEVISHLVLPLFVSLGWPRDRIAVEWGRVDTAFFDDTPTHPENCVMVLEAKLFGQELGDVLEQPRGYVERLGLESVRSIITTDGDNLFVFRRRGSGWDPEPYGYLRMSSLRKEYALPRNTDLVRTLFDLRPNAV